ncbi:MAG: response regulator transcription factor [Planctomycetota bacterium]
MKVLLIEDSERLRRSLETGLRRSGFAVVAVGDGREGLDHARYGGFDAIVLDLLLPGLDGMTVLRQLRSGGSTVHVLILSAKDRVDERITGLSAGADDYLVKPFEFDELVARLRALGRRQSGRKDPVHRVGAFAIDTGARTVRAGDTTVELSRREFHVLEYLLAHRGRVVTKVQLVDQLYPDAERGSENAVEVFVHQLRKKLLAVANDDPIQTRRGHGYLVP